MPNAASTPITVDELLAAYEGREGKKEIEDGGVYATAGEQLDHARVKGETYIALRDSIRCAGLAGEAVTDSVLVRIAPNTAYRPDALVYCGERLPPKTREVPTPAIVVEVISPASEKRDVRRKLLGYSAAPSVAHYLLLHPEHRTALHLNRNPSGGIEMRPKNAGPLRLDPPGLDLALEDLFGEA